MIPLFTCPVPGTTAIRATRGGQASGRRRTPTGCGTPPATRGPLPAASSSMATGTIRLPRAAHCSRRSPSMSRGGRRRAGSIARAPCWTSAGSILLCSSGLVGTITISAIGTVTAGTGSIPGPRGAGRITILYSRTRVADIAMTRLDSARRRPRFQPGQVGNRRRSSAAARPVLSHSSSKAEAARGLRSRAFQVGPCPGGRRQYLPTLGPSCRVDLHTTAACRVLATRSLDQRPPSIVQDTPRATVEAGIAAAAMANIMVGKGSRFAMVGAHSLMRKV
jgi:hypothetical protein